MIVIGEIRKIITPFYDLASSSMRFKFRPGLIIAQADSDDYVVLPISTISRRSNRNLSFDIELDPSQFPLLGLRSVSFARTHKQTTVHRGEIGDCIGDMKTSYPDLFLRVLEARECFSEEISSQALS